MSRTTAGPHRTNASTRVVPFAVSMAARTGDDPRHRGIPPPRPARPAGPGAPPGPGVRRRGRRQTVEDLPGLVELAQGQGTGCHLRRPRTSNRGRRPRGCRRPRGLEPPSRSRRARRATSRSATTGGGGAPIVCRAVDMVVTACSARPSAASSEACSRLLTQDSWVRRLASARSQPSRRDRAARRGSPRSRATRRGGQIGIGDRGVGDQSDLLGGGQGLRGQILGPFDPSRPRLHQGQGAEPAHPPDRVRRTLGTQAALDPAPGLVEVAGQEVGTASGDGGHGLQRSGVGQAHDLG